MSDRIKGIIALVNLEDRTLDTIKQCNFNGHTTRTFKSGVELCHLWESEQLDIVAIISQSEVIAPTGIYLLETIEKSGSLPSVPFILIAHKVNHNLAKLCLQSGVADLFANPVNGVKLSKRVNFLIEHWGSLRSKKSASKLPTYKTPTVKRIFDILFSGSVLICLSPILLLIIIIMKLESKGPVFYYSLRVGTGYKIFKFYKLRSMYVNADQRLKDLKHLNQYKGKDDSVQEVELNTLCDHCVRNGTPCQQVIYSDSFRWCEKNYINTRRALRENAFIKIKNDPRVTRVGKILRNTSIDELPQLWNVLIGDMSIVGNRPLPLYEAEKLTTDKYAMRFMAPAGITGLWQVEKRGKGEMSAEERMMLDNAYAENHSFVNDIKLILKTIPALLQKESV